MACLAAVTQVTPFSQAWINCQIPAFAEAGFTAAQGRRQSPASPQAVTELPGYSDRLAAANELSANLRFIAPHAASTRGGYLSATDLSVRHRPKMVGKALAIWTHKSGVALCVCFNPMAAGCSRVLRGLPLHKLPQLATGRRLDLQRSRSRRSAARTSRCSCETAQGCGVRAIPLGTELDVCRTSHLAAAGPADTRQTLLRPSAAPEPLGRGALGHFASSRTASPRLL
jgi:hypothetical protein